MHILLLSTYFKPDITANGILLTQLTNQWQKMGHEVTVITSMPHYATNRIWNGYRGKLCVREQMDGLDIYRVYLYVPQSKTSMLGRLFNYVSFNLLSTIVAMVRKRPDIIFVPSPPLTNGISGYFLSTRFRIPFVYNVQDIYPDIAIRLGVLTNQRAIAIFKAMERFVYRKAEAVSVISDGFRRNLLVKAVPDRKIAVIPNFVDTEFIKPLPRNNDFSDSQNLDDRFVVLFAGNVGLSQGLDTVLVAAEQLAIEPEILFLIVGNGVAKLALEEQVAQKGLTNVRFLPFQPHEVVPEMYATADVCLVPLKAGITHESVPSKVFSIMAAERPLVASVDDGSDTWDLVQDAGCGVCVEPENPQSLADAILYLHSDRTRATEMGLKGRVFVEQNFTKEKIAQQYISLFERILNEKI